MGARVDQFVMKTDRSKVSEKLPVLVYMKVLIRTRITEVPHTLPGFGVHIIGARMALKK